MNKYFLFLLAVFMLTACTQQNTPQSSITPSTTPLATETSKPTLPTNWREHSINVNNSTLTFSTPVELYVNSEEQKNLTTNQSYALTLYIQNYKETISEVEKPYQLYGIYQWDTAESTIEQFKESTKDLDNLQETTIDGLPAISGQIKGQRNRFVTYILYKGHTFTLATSEATEENKQLTEKILQTFDFK